MKIDCSTVIKNLEGQELGEDGVAFLDDEGQPIPRYATPADQQAGNVSTRKLKPLTLKSLACTALNATFEDEKNLSGEEKTKRFMLAMKIVDGGVVDLAAKDVTLLQKLIGKAFGPLYVGRANEILEPKVSVTNEAEAAAATAESN